MAVREALRSIVESALETVSEATSGSAERDQAMAKLVERLDALDERLGMESLEARLAALEQVRETETEDSVTPLLARVEALEDQVAKVDKRLQMAMAAIQAATTQLMEVKETAIHAKNQAQQANQRATSAQTTAESAVEGVSGIEGKVGDLLELAAATAPDAPDAPAPSVDNSDGSEGQDSA